MKTDFSGSNTPKEIRDRWQTPYLIFKALDNEFNFRLDAAADKTNALCCRFISEEDNALEIDWSSTGSIYCNPPYSNILPWIHKAAKECKERVKSIVMLVPADTSVGWFKVAMETVDEVRLITGGRISFINADTGKQVNGNTKGSMLLIWRPFIKPRGVITTVDKDELIEIGNRTGTHIKIA
uniref:DNA N-6-adenine-methyltransferase (Dam) n=1 Tax=Arsenophonus endosymbiont of Trialeurodes vaporariorum TaxID=235567 RepID=A0A3B0MLL6_9GAMM